MYWEYLLFMAPTYMLVLIIQISLKVTVSKYSSLQSSMCGRDSARLVLTNGGVTGVDVGRVKGELTDYYDPSRSIISLSDSTYEKYTLTAVGVAAHEAGHAIQYSENYGPAKLRQAAVNVCNIGSRFSVPLIIAGYILSFEPLVIAGIVCFMFVVAFQLITLPVEFNASRRAVKILSESGRFSADEIKGVRRVLTAASLTYVGALAMSTMQLAYYISRFRRR